MMGNRVISCNSPYGVGGIGQHLAYLVEKSRKTGELVYYFSNQPEAGDDQGVRVVANTYGLLKYTPLRYSPSWKSHLLNERFDAAVANRLEASAQTFMGFAGKSLRSFERAADLNYECLELVAPNSHVENVYALHQQAYRDSGIRDTWLNRAQVRKTLEEYKMADAIYVHSTYVANSLRENGIPKEKLVHTRLPVHARFSPPSERVDDDVFRIVYVGRVDATKGIHLLLKAFERLPIRDAELRLVGGWSTRRMRKYMESWLEKGQRITIEAGDPLPVLRKADVLVHPTYEDGFGYAPMEALACGVPVIITEDTGMKEYVDSGVNGYVVPTGDLDALVNRITDIYENPLVTNKALCNHDKVMGSH